MQPRPTSRTIFFLSSLIATFATWSCAGPNRLSSGGPPARVEVRLLDANGKPLERARPLDRITALAPHGHRIVVSDGRGRDYASATLIDAGGPRRAEILVGGALGSHFVRVEDIEGRVLGTAGVRIDCETGFEEEVSQAKGATQGEFAELLEALYNTMKNVAVTRLFGRDYRHFVSWIRDHAHVLKAMKYFYPELFSGVDLYRDTQRPDGMIWDNHERAPQLNHWDDRFADFGFVGRFEDVQFRRIPVEADVEYLYVEAIWNVWRATGDDAWLTRTIDSGIRALMYSMTDPIRWSQKYQLVRRGYTIDTWDFQHEEDAAILGDPMKVDPAKTRFGIMFGDNTGLVASSNYLAEMLNHLGRESEANEWRARARDVQARLDALAWNGRFYTHHVPEDPSVKRDLGGTDPAEQISLSNAYSLNRGMPLDKRTAIIREYLRIKDNLPPGSPGEWYTIFPIFQKGFGHHNSHWHYMNGGVVTIVAGELARGAFESGFEDYGSDILRRILALTREYGRRLPVTYRGADPPPRPAANFRPLSLAKIANVALTEDSAARFRTRKTPLPAWGNFANNDLPGFPRGRQTFKGVPFDILADEDNQGRVALGLYERRSSDGKPAQDGYVRTASLPVGGKARTLFFLHTVSNTSGPVGTITWHYSDGARATHLVQTGRDIIPWWYPEVSFSSREGRGDTSAAAIAWEGKNASASRVGVTLLALDNPRPDKDIARIEWTAAPNDAKWFVLGVTASDQPAGLNAGKLSFGIPDNWGAAAVAYALIEGLAGIEDRATRFEHARITPRWPSAGVPHIVATAKYPASEGYVRYRYHVASPNTLELDVTGSGASFELRVLLPPGKGGQTVTVGEQPVAFQREVVGNSRYVSFTVKGAGAHRVVVGM